MKGPFTQCVSVCITCQWYFYFILFLVSCMCLCTWVRNLHVCLSLFVYFVNYLVLSNDYSQLIAIQNKSFYLHNICVCTVYIYYVYVNSHTYYLTNKTCSYIYICNGWVKCRAQILSMGHHTWPYVTFTSLQLCPALHDMLYWISEKC